MECPRSITVSTGVCGTLGFGSIPSVGYQKKMNKENKLVPGLPSGFEDRWGKKLLLKKKLLKAIENNFIKFGAEALETPSRLKLARNIGSFLAEDDS